LGSENISLVQKLPKGRKEEKTYFWSRARALPTTEKKRIAWLICCSTMKNYRRKEAGGVFSKFQGKNAPFTRILVRNPMGHRAILFKRCQGALAEIARQQGKKTRAKKRRGRRGSIRFGTNEGRQPSNKKRQPFLGGGPRASAVLVRHCKQDRTKVSVWTPTLKRGMLGSHIGILWPKMLPGGKLRYPANVSK